MKRIEFTTINGNLVNFKINEIAVVLAKYKLKETAIYVTGGNSSFIVKGSYAEIMQKIEGAENADI